MAEPQVQYDPTRVRSGVEGDLVIQLLGSLSGEKPRAVETARSLSLRRPGDQAIGFLDDDAYAGRAAKYPHLLGSCALPESVAVPGRGRKPLPKHSKKRRKSQPTQQSFGDGNDLHAAYAWRNLVRDRSYESADGDVQGEFFEFANEEYVQVETDSDGAVVLWSSDMSFSDALERMSRIVGSPSHDIEGFLITHANEPVDLPSDDVVERAIKDPDNVAYFVASYGLSSVSWRDAQVKLKKGTTAHVECSVAGRHVKMEDLQGLIASTATSRVVEAVQEQTGPLVRALGSSTIS